MVKGKGCLKAGHLLLFLCLFLAGSLQVSAQEKGRVLFISSYSWETVQLQTKGMKAGLGEAAEIDYEYMDTGRIYDEISQKQFYEGLAYRLSVLDPYDVVILGDNGALFFALEHRDTLFAGIPMVFFGVDDGELAGKAVQSYGITGIIEKSSVEKNLLYGLKVNPEAKKAVAILDDSREGKEAGRKFYEQAENFPQLLFSEINASKLSKWDFQLALKQVTQDSILLYLGVGEAESDADTLQQGYAAGEPVQIMNQWAAAPVICMREDEVGQGFLGGNLVSDSRAGELAAGLAAYIMEGGTGMFGVVQESPCVYFADELVADKFQLDMSVFPGDTVIVNHHRSFWERNREGLIPAGILTGALLAVMAFVLYGYHRSCSRLRKVEAARKTMESTSMHDFLTGLPNRGKFEADLQESMAQQRPCTIMMIDIDDFKNINDTHGHNAGDDALRQVSVRLKEIQSRILTPYRYAGDEFIVMIHSSQNRIIAQAAGQCRDIFRKPFFLNGKKDDVCGSIGIASYPQDAENMEELIVRADAAMYRVKKSGKNAFAFYQKEEGM